ncbi:MAG: hypothetical protein HY238_17315, partial [Acidobacteria bacterium]|nr:hypothetical protein [Acidobacteriota bacterium]
MKVRRLVGLVLVVCSSVFAGDNPLSGIFSPENLKAAKTSGVEVSPGARPDTLVLRFHPGEEAGAVTVPVPPAARDWTSSGAFTFEFTSDSTIRWMLQIRNGRGQEFTYRVQPFQNVPVKAAITASFLTREYINNRQFRGYWISNWGNHIDLTDVRSLAVSMLPNREVTLRLGPLALVRDTVADEVYIDQPVVDALGQWRATEWPGKVHSPDELRRAWKQEDE